MTSKKTFYSRIKLLISDPKNNLKKIRPFIASRIFILKRKALESLGNYDLSKPYPGHDELLKYLEKEKGFFVEVGGNDGYLQDPTYFLEKKLGWKGIIIEPLQIADLCQQNRKNSTVIKAAMVPFDYKKEFVTLVDCNAMSIIKEGVDDYEKWVKEGEIAQNLKSEEIDVPARKLNEILDKYFSDNKEQNIDLLTIDVEGYELNVLKGLNLEKYRPTYLLIEILSEKLKADIDEYLKDKYRFIGIIGNDDHLYKIN